MTLIEGIGDEVTVFFCIVLILTVIALAWLSTGIRDIPFIGVIIIELTTRHRRRQVNQDTQAQQTSTTTSPDSNTSVGDQSQAEISQRKEGHGDQELQGQGKGTGQGVQKGACGIQSTEDKVVVEEIDKGQGNISQEKDDNVNIDPCQEASRDSNKSGGVQDVQKEFVDKIGGNIVITEISGSELRHRRVAFFENAQRSERSETDTVSFSVRNVNSSGSSQSSEQSQTHNVENSSILDSESAVPRDVGIENFSQCKTETNVLQNGARPVISDSSSASQTQVLSDDKIETDSKESRPNSETDGERSTSTPTSENVTAPSGSGETNPSNMEDEGSGVIRIRLKYFNDSQRQVAANLTDTVETFRRTHFSTEMSENKLIRFIFNGHELCTNTSTLQAYNVQDNSVIHCLITQNNTQEARTQVTEDDDTGFDMGVFMFPLFGLLLAIIWYFRFTYRQFFNVTSTLSLGGITFLFLAALFASFRRRQGHEHLD